MDTTHYAAFYEPVVAAYHIIQNYRVKGAIVSHYGDQVHRALESMVQDVAKQGKREGGALKPYEPILADARATVTTAFFGMKALTILDTFFGGVTTSLSTVSPRAFFTALSLDSPVRDSVVLEGRRKTFLRELAEQEAILSNPQTSPRRRLLALSTRALMFPMGVVQERIDSMVWHATYAQAVLDNVADPVRHADAAVTTLSPTGTQHGMSMVQRGNEMEKSLTAFMSWTLPVLSNSWRLYNAGKRGQGYGRLVQYTILASVLPSLIAAVLRDEIPDDDDDDWIDFTRWAVADFMLAPYLGGVPVLNSAVPITKGQSISHSLAVEGLLTQSVKGAVAVFDVLSGEKDLDDLTKSDINGMLMLVSGMSVMVGGVALPVSQTNELIQLATHWDELDDLRDLLRFKE
jgi:hypothetical protein